MPQGELEHKRVKHLYEVTNKNQNFQGQIAQGVRRSELLDRWGRDAGFPPVKTPGCKKQNGPGTLRRNERTQADRLRHIRVNEPSDMDKAPANEHYQISYEERHYFNINEFIAENWDDEACAVSTLLVLRAHR